MFWGSGQRFCRSRHRDQYAAAVDDLLSRAAGVAGVQEAVGEALLKSDDRSVQLGVGIAGAFIHAGNPFFLKPNDAGGQLKHLLIAGLRLNAGALRLSDTAGVIGSVVHHPADALRDFVRAFAVQNGLAHFALQAADERGSLLQIFKGDFGKGRLGIPQGAGKNRFRRPPRNRPAHPGAQPAYRRAWVVPPGIRPSRTGIRKYRPPRKCEGTGGRSVESCQN